MSKLMRYVLAVSLLSSLLFSGNASTAAAESWWDRLKEVYRLPDQVDRMEQQLSEAIRKSEEAEQRYREAEERWMAENAALRRANEELSERLLAAEASAAKRQADSARWKRLAITGAILVALYFLLARLLRVYLWRRERKRQGGVR